MSDLVHDLLRPDAYPPGVDGSRPAHVALEETHISWVFLTETEAWKVKKPVELGFLDFSALELRHVACEEEVRLNRRLSPDVYLGVEPVLRAPDGRFRLHGEGEVADYAVRMVRLPAARTAESLLDAGELGPEEIDRIAACIASFHGACETSPEIARGGSAENLRRLVVENLEQTRDALAALLAPGEVNDLAAGPLGFLERNEALFRERAAAGFVRDGHGDLRLEHVYLLDDRRDDRGDRIRVLDAIEFDPRYRYADVAADVAFLSMELRFRGRSDLAERFLGTYAREAQDYELYRLVDFYEGYRAWVRGKIASLAARLHLDDGAREHALREARRFLLLALAEARPPLVPLRIVAVGGLLAAGKSTVADLLATDLGGPVVDADRTRKHLAGVESTRPLPEKAWTGVYDPSFTDDVYHEVLRRAEAVLDGGRPVVLDASFRSAAWRRAARDLARRRGVPFLFVECRAPEGLLLERLARRRGGVSDGRLDLFTDFKARFEPAVELPASLHMVLDTSRPLPETMTLLRDRALGLADDSSSDRGSPLADHRRGGHP